MSVTITLSNQQKAQVKRDLSSVFCPQPGKKFDPSWIEILDHAKTIKLPSQARQTKLDPVPLNTSPITNTTLNSKGDRVVSLEQRLPDRQDTSAIAVQSKINADKQRDKLAKDLAVLSAKHDQNTVTKHDPAILPQNDKGIVKIANKEDSDPVKVTTDDQGKIKILDQGKISFASLSILFSDDLTQVIKRKEKRDKIKIPTFRKIVVTKKLEVVSIIDGRSLDTIFIDKLGYRVYEDNKTRFGYLRFGYLRFARKNKDLMISYLEEKHRCEIAFKEDSVTVHRLGIFSIYRVSFTDVIRPYDGDPKVEDYFLVFKNENIVLGKYETLDLAKMAVIYQ